MDAQQLLETAARAAAVYVFVLFIVRLLGKREIGSLGAFDFLVALMIGEVVDEIIFGDVSMAQGFVAISAIAALELANSWASFKSRWFDRLTGGSPAVLIQHGKLDRSAMASERMNEDELMAQLRKEGIEKVSEVKKATLEPDGQLSVIKEEWAKELQKGDLKELRRAVAS
jgi:uncharacterized membrane protein YcaP (DUF421 family)